MSYSLQGARNDDNQRAPTGREERTLAYRRRPASPTASGGRFELLPTNVFETPWDPVTPDVNTTSFPGGSPFPPRYDGRYDSASDAERPLLHNKERPSTTDLSDVKRTQIDPTSGSTIYQRHHHDEYGVFEEFGPVPGSANSRAEFLPPSPPHPEMRRSLSTWIRASHPWWPDTFEPIHWPPLIVLTIVVLVTYPILWLAALIAQEKSLFWSRFIVGSAASVLGFTLGLGMMEVAKRLLEAATWATLIHRSMDGSGGLTLGDLDAKSTYPNFTYLGVRLFIERNISRIFWRAHRPYDKKPWSLYVLFFIIISLLAAGTTFLLGRLVDITTANWQQDRFYRKITAIGDLNLADIERSRVQLAATESFVQTWTLSYFGANGQQPVKLQFEGEDIYFAELSSHLLPGRLGLGTFQQDMGMNGGALDIVPSKSPKDHEGVGSIVRHSRWGIRIKCSKIPDSRQYIVPIMAPSNYTYLYVPKDTISSLMSGLGLQDTPFSWDNRFLQEGDQVPQGIDMSKIGLVGSWKYNGVAQSFFTYTIDQGESGRGWVVLNTVMIRLNRTYTPNGSFAVYSEDGQIGYDTAVCVENIEPWVLDAYNSTTGRVQTLRVLGKGGLSTLRYDFGKDLGASNVDGLESTLNSTGKFAPFAVAHDNSRNQILKDNGRDFAWVPNPTAISWTDGFGPSNYTSLSAIRLQGGLGNADAAQLLPYLTGSQPIVAYQYTEDVLAYATVLPAPTILTLLAILLLGFASAFLVPRLPLNIPRRDFGLFTWIATFEGDGILNQAITHQSLDRNMDLEELQRKYARQKVRYGA